MPRKSKPVTSEKQVDTVQKKTRKTKKVQAAKESAEAPAKKRRTKKATMPIPILNRAKQEEAVVKVRRKRKVAVKTETKEVDDRKYIDEVLKSCKPKGVIIRFHNYILSRSDKFNLALEYRPKEAAVFLGYYPATMDGFIKALETIAGKLVMDTSNATKANALSNLNTLLMALHEFKLYISNKFVMSRHES